MKEKITISSEDHMVQVDESVEDNGSVIEVNKRGVAEVHETHESDMATEAAEHEVDMRDAKKKAGLVSDDAYYNITSPVRAPD